MALDFENLRAQPAVDTALFVSAERVRELASTASILGDRDAIEAAIREAIRETVHVIRRHHRTQER